MQNVRPTLKKKVANYYLSISKNQYRFLNIFLSVCNLQSSIYNLLVGKNDFIRAEADFLFKVL